MAHSTGVAGVLSHIASWEPNTGNRREDSPPAWNPCSTEKCDLLGGALARLDLNHLATTVLAAGWANVVSLLGCATFAARNQSRCSQEMMTAAVALAVTTNFLLWKSTHFKTPDLAASAAIFYVYRQPGDARFRGAIGPRYPAIVVVQQTDHLRQHRHRYRFPADPGNPGHMLASSEAQAQSIDAAVRSNPVRGHH